MATDRAADLDVALREFAEELGAAAPALLYDELGTFRYSSGKTMTVFTADAPDLDLAGMRSNTFELE
jgi:predicted NUDIX family NTP pyrophosphohydrolase